MMPLVDWSWGETYSSPPMMAAIAPASSTADPFRDAALMDAKMSEDVPDETPDYALTDSPRSKDQAQDYWVRKGYSYISNSMGTSAAVTACLAGAAPPPAAGSPALSSGTERAPSSFAQRIKSHRPRLRTLMSAGRKRSCAEISSDDDSSLHSTMSSVSNLSGSPTKSAAMMDGDDVAMMNGSNHFAEELAERLRTSTFPEQARGRPDSGESRKSIRLDPDSPASQDLDPAITASAGSEPTFRENGVGGNSGIDEAAIALGIAWSTIPATAAMNAATRGWARYIETQYPLQAAKVMWKNNAIPAYLVEAVTREAPGRCGSPGYFLFDEELTQARLIANSWDRAIDNLRCTPCAFDGENVLIASSLAATANTANATNVAVAPSAISVGGDCDVDML